MTDRRTLKFQSMDDLLADIESFQNDAVDATGGWTPGQIVEHVALIVNDSIDGFQVTAPLGLRLLAKLIKGRVLTKPFNPGIKLPANMVARYDPPSATTWDNAVANLRRGVERIRNGERMTALSPVFGRFTHEQWVQLHCRHAEMHFSFLHAAPDRAS